eukprot:GHUV01041810.1.p1 GENE.GHUV01041810.1~~GHUV01041810.1.p1  ORF type:complete len:161 (-),score=21.74 GHUV01041810.1:56-538(-)
MCMSLLACDAVCSVSTMHLLSLPCSSCKSYVSIEHCATLCRSLLCTCSIIFALVDSILPTDDPEDSDWQPFDFLMWRFIHGDDNERCSLFKMIPRIAEGSWLIKQSVGTTPVILARKLATQFFVTEKYVEVAVDVGSSSTAQYVTGMVGGVGGWVDVDLL